MKFIDIKVDFNGKLDDISYVICFVSSIPSLKDVRANNAEIHFTFGLVGKGDFDRTMMFFLNSEKNGGAHDSRSVYAVR